VLPGDFKSDFPTTARELKGKEMSKSDIQDAQEFQEFKLHYQREHAIAYLQRKMGYHY